MTTQSTTPITLSIFYGPIDRNGEMPLQMFFDHRVIDGSSVNRISLGIQAVLNREILAELNKDPTTSQASRFTGADEVIV